MPVLISTRQHFAAIDKIAGDLVTHENEVLGKNKQTGADLYSRSRIIAFAMLALSLGIGGVVLWMVRQISSTLRQIAGEMADGAEQVSAAAGQVSSSSQSLAQGSSEQAGSIEETSASSEEIHSMARKNTENSRMAADSMNEASQRVVEANRNLEPMVISMNEINVSSDKISKIIKVIDEIAFHSRAERRGRSRTRGRSRHGICSCGRRGPQPGATLRPSGQGYGRTDRRVHYQIQRW